LLGCVLFVSISAAHRFEASRIHEELRQLLGEDLDLVVNFIADFLGKEYPDYEKCESPPGGPRR
jgi:hypothetical protein